MKILSGAQHGLPDIVIILKLMKQDRFYSGLGIMLVVCTYRKGGILPRTRSGTPCRRRWVHSERVRRTGPGRTRPRIAGRGGRASIRILSCPRMTRICSGNS